MNMKNLTKIFGALLIVITLNSCATLTTYTTSVQRKYRLTEEDVKNLQFYTRGDIVLYKKASDGATYTEDGELIISEQSEVDKILIRDNTHGVAEKLIGENKIAVSFEDGKFLIFGATNDRGRYTLQAKEWTRNRRGKLKYGEDDYYAAPSSADAYLVFKLRKSTQKSNSERVVGGKKL